MKVCSQTTLFPHWNSHFESYFALYGPNGRPEKNNFINNHRMKLKCWFHSVRKGNKRRQSEEQKPCGDEALLKIKGHSSAEYSGQQTAAEDSQRCEQKHPVYISARDLSLLNVWQQTLFTDVSQETWAPCEVSGDGEECDFLCGGVIILNQR